MSIAPHSVAIPTISQYKEISKKVYEEILAAKNGDQSSLHYLPNPVIGNQDIGSTKVRFAIIGGSVLQTGDVASDGSYTNMVEREFEPLPDAQSFLELIEECIKEETEVLLVNFSFPSEAYLKDSQLRMKLIQATKMHRFEGLVGQDVGVAIEKHYESKGQTLKTHVSHDQTALIANIQGQFSDDSIIGGVVGTGYNFGFIEDGQVINLEMANFGQFELDEQSKKLDDESIAPGKSLSEKMIAGAYLYQHYNIAAESNPELNKINSTKDLYEKIKDGNEAEKETALRIFRRSAGFVAAQIKGVIDYKLSQDSSLDQFNIVIEGSIYKRNRYFREFLFEYLEDFGLNEDIEIKFITKNKSQIKGIIRTVYKVEN